ncbi:MAG: adenylate/guanylate cyclase domain-containing protein [Alphaproteobacteria bacterium]
MSSPVQRHLAAIIAADVAGFSRLVGADEEGTIAALRRHRAELIDPQIAAHDGRIANTAGDSLLIEFPSVVAAIRCAVAVQRAMTDRNADIPSDRRIEFRVGVNLGDVIVEGQDIHGQGVNIAARLESFAAPGGMAVSAAAYDHARGHIEEALEDAGPQQFKNIEQPVQVWRWHPAAPAHTDGVAAGEPAGPLPLPDKPSIAVLPFDNMSNDAEQDYFADGITEDLITGLSRVRWLFVIARNSSFVYKGRAADVRHVAAELGVRYVLEGSVRKAGNRVRITAQLIDARTSNHVWAERYDGELTNIFDLQDEITEQVAGAIEPAILAAEGVRARDRSGDDLDAWELLMQAVARFWRFTEADAKAAQALLETATERYPDYAPAHSMHAFVLLLSAHVGWLPLAQTRERATDLAERANALDEHDAWTHVVLGYLYTMNRNTDAAVRSFSRAIDLNANFASAYGWRAMAHAHAGLAAEALADVDMAMRLSPKDPQNAVFLGARALAHFMADEFDVSAAIAADSLRHRPGWLSSYRMECTALARAGRQLEAEASLARLLEKQPNVTAARLRASLPYPTDECMEKFVGGLILAGLPET